MKENRQIITVLDNGTDWIALYINDKKVTEGHSLSYRDIFVALGLDWEIVEGNEDMEFPNELVIKELNIPNK